jgi:membrane protein
MAFGLILAVGFLLIVSLVTRVPSWLPWVVVWALSSAAGRQWWRSAMPLVASSSGVDVRPDLQGHAAPARAGGRRLARSLACCLALHGGKYVIGAYIGRSGIASGFGAAGSLVVVLLWVCHLAAVKLRQHRKLPGGRGGQQPQRVVRSAHGDGLRRPSASSTCTI